MPNRSQHERQVGHNRAFIASLDLDTTPFLDWVVTASFYTVVHMVEAVLADTGTHTRSHEERSDWITRVSQFRRIYDYYRDLQDWSEQARYKCVRFNREFVRDEILPVVDAVGRELGFP